MPATRRVLMTTDTVGGVWIYSLHLARRFGARGIQTQLATMGPPLERAQRAAAHAIPGLTLFESQYRLEWMQSPWEDVDRAGDWLLDLAQRLRPDLVHLNNYAHGALPWRVPALVVGHSCVHSWWHAVHGSEPPASYAPYTAAVKAGLAGADEVVAPSAAMAAALVRHYGATNPQVIHNGLDPQGFFSGPKEPLVLSVGRLWDAAKNVQTLARAATHFPWPLYVAGEVRHPDGGEAHVEGVHHLGNLVPAELHPWYARAAIYALPARYEPFGLTILEAALSGCALVLGDIPSLRELWDGAAVFVDPQDEQAIGAAIRTLAEDPARLRAAMAAAHQRARLYTLQRSTDAYLRLYEAMQGQVSAIGNG